MLRIALAVAAAAIPIPEVGDPDTPRFVGEPATQRPIAAPPSPRHPHMAPNGSSNLHEDAWQTDASPRAGPLGRGVSVLSNFFLRDCASITFDSRGRIVTNCVGLERPVLTLMDPATLDVIARLELPPRDPTAGSNPFTGFAGGGYFYLDESDRAVIPTTTRHIVIVKVEGDSLVVERDLDLSGSVPQGDAIISALPDWAGRLWFASRDGVLGTVDEATGAAHTVELEPIGNSFAVSETGGVYVVTDAALYRFGAADDGVPQQAWRRTYENSGVVKPGQTQAGSGTTPTLMARNLVAITDNADPMNVVVFTRDGREICRTPVFEKGASSTDQSLIAAGRALIAENNHGYSGPMATDGGRTTTPGLERVDVRKDLSGCVKRWRSEEIAPSAVPKVSLPNGLVYTWTKPPGGADPWYLTALDFRTGETVYKALGGDGLGFNNNYAPVTIGPDGTAYIGVLGGIVAMRDAQPPPQPTGRPQPRLRLVVRCGRGARLRGRDTDWVRSYRVRRKDGRAVARITLTDGRVVKRTARRPRCRPASER